MVNYKELYDSLDNTLTHEVVKKIIEEYLKTGVIDNYLKCYNYSKVEEKINNISDVEQEKLLSNHSIYFDKLYSMIFNEWKHTTSNLTDSQIKSMIDEGLVDDDYYEVRDYLKNAPYIEHAKDFRSSISGNDVCSKYSKKVFIGNGWEHFFSRLLIYPLQEKINVEHRLYLNPFETDCYELAYLFAEKCLFRKIPFYFKMDNSVADDKIVIYSDTEHLKKYIKLLEEIKKEHPNIVANCSKPPVLCGVIDNWIGYGSQPKQNSYSFNSIREKIIEMVLDESIGRMKKKYFGKQIQLNDKVVEDIRQKILEIGKQVGVDRDKFCFDIDKRDKLFEYEKTNDKKDELIDNPPTSTIMTNHEKSYERKENTQLSNEDSILKELANVIEGLTKTVANMNKTLDETIASLNKPKELNPKTNNKALIKQIKPNDDKK